MDIASVHHNQLDSGSELTDDDTVTFATPIESNDTAVVDVEGLEICGRLMLENALQNTSPMLLYI